MEDQNRKIEDVLNSLEGIRKPQVNPFLFEKIKHKMASRSEVVSKTVVSKWAIALTVVVVLNVFTWLQTNARKPNASANLKMLASEYGFSNIGYQY